MADQMQQMTLLSESPEQTFGIGRAIASGLGPGDIVALTGELGAGKTCLTQGIAAGLGVPEDYAITSPTFTLINEYPARDLTLYHMDAYRLAGCADLDEMGFEECLSGQGVMVIEWAERIQEAIPWDALFVSMSYIDEKKRKIELSSRSEKMRFWEGTLNKGGF